MAYEVLVLAPCEESSRAKLRAATGDKCEFTFVENTASRKQLAAARVIIGEPDAEQLAAATSLEWLQLTWAGADQYARMTDFPSGILLTNASGAFGHIIAEYTLGMLVALYRKFPAYWQNQREHVWQPQEADESIFGKNALVLGTGDIGSRIGAVLGTFGARVTGMNRSGGIKPGQTAFENIYPISTLDEHLPEADIVVGALPATAETRGLLDKGRLWKMRKNAVLINVGRGNLLSCADLAEIMRAGHLRGAALDVMDTEPLPQDSPLWEMENVILTPHIAGPSFSGDTRTASLIWDICIDNLQRRISGKKLRNVVDLARGY